MTSSFAVTSFFLHKNNVTKQLQLLSIIFNVHNI